MDQTELHDRKDGDSGLHPLASPEAHQNESLLGRGGDHSRFSDKQQLNLSKHAPSNISNKLEAEPDDDDE